MKKTALLIYTCIAIILFTRCTRKITPEKTETPAEQIARIKAQYTPAQVAEGKTIFENKCNKCHDLRQPGEFTVREWNKILPTMVHKAKLSKQNADTIYAWIITNAKEG